MSDECSDINHYSEYISSLKQKELMQYFTALRELGQMYLIDCTSGDAKTRRARAKELAVIISDTDRYLGIFTVDEVYAFAERRADWYTIKGDVTKAMYGMCTVM